ncbi:MAG: tetratricopeptide repeat protein [Vicinamibacteria bacterium]
MNCPRCGRSDVEGESCPRCGVVFSKLRSAAPRRAPHGTTPAPAPPAPEPGRGPLATLALVALALALGTGSFLWVRGSRKDETNLGRPVLPQAGEPQSNAAAVAELAASLPTPAPLETTAPRLPVEPAAEAETASGLRAEDVRAANLLADRVNMRGPAGAITTSDLARIDELLARAPSERGLLAVAEAVFVKAAAQERDAHRLPRALELARKAVNVHPEGPQGRLFVMTILIDSGDWGGAEAVAREIVARDSRNADGFWGLGYALFRQDRNREAAEALEAAVQLRDHPEARQLLARIRKTQEDEGGMTEQKLAHFHVRYDGEEHVEVGREILRSLERHYATLIGTLDHQPQSTIAVILFTRDKYYTASGAPAWSGGVYDNTDGRIRIPIGGLTASLSPEMDGTLIHELTHAFLADKTRGVAPRELHEGLAQYMEGKRLASELRPEELRALADGRVAGVGGFYLQALAFVEDLIALRGMGGVNDLARAMGETGSADEAFRRVYGKDLAGTRRDSTQRLRSRYGS